ncbi:MAG TPA: hemolysin III family protein [Gemmatimonadales bacterium]|nr:hemolysin III family protein [Gemmatimonadales bacterium]
MRTRSASEELANAATHGVGLALSVLALPLLLGAALRHGDPPLVAGTAVFAASLVTLYLASTLYHGTRPSRAKEWLRIVDHSAIFLLIAGTYTPFTLGVLRGPWGWWLFGVIWALALLGISAKVLIGTRFPRASTAFYLLMGWLAVIALRPLASALPAAGLGWLVAGGLLYTAGVTFYLRDRRWYDHPVWHLFVLAGSACHFVAVWAYAIAASGPTTLRV